MNRSNVWRVLMAVFLTSFAMSVSGARLEVGPDSHFALRWSADLILYIHILGGTIGLIAGLIASLVKKGAFLHRKYGRIFLFSMLACYLIGAVVAPFLHEGQRPNFIAAVLAIYLLISGIQAAKNRSYTYGPFNTIGLVISLLVTAMGMLFMVMGFNSESGTVDGSPPEAFVFFVIAGTLSAIGEIRLLVLRQLTPQARIYRHLWRMGFSFFIASGSLFFGQAKMFPQWFNDSPLPGFLSVFPLLLVLYWTVTHLIQQVRQRLKSTRISAAHHS